MDYEKKDVKLTHPINYQGQQIDRLTIRSATVADLKMVGDLGQLEPTIKMASHLSSLPPDAIEMLDVRDWAKVKGVMADFFGIDHG